MTRCVALTLLVSAMMTSSTVRSAAQGRDALEALRQSNAGVRRILLDNGMIALLKEDASAPVVAVQIWVGTGSVHEEEHLGAGLSHYMEHMIFKGTPTRGPAEITKTIDEAGGEINAYTAHDRTVFHADLPSKSWKVGVDVLSDAVMHAAFPEEEWQREKEVILREFAMGYDSPDRELNKLLWSTAFRVHPYRLPVIGYEEIFRTITREDLLAFFHRHYVPDNMMIVIVGAINADEVEAHLRTTFKDFTRRTQAPVLVPSEPPQVAPREGRKTGVYELSRGVLAWHTVDLSHPDAPALDVLSAVVGHGRSARLEVDLKERRQLVHSIDAWSFTPREPGLFGISFSCEADQESAVLAALDEHIAAWRKEPFSAEELEKARRQTLVNELAQLQTASGQATSYASGEFYAGNPRFSEIYLQHLQEITPDRLREVAARYLTPDNRSLAMLAPAMNSTTNAASTSAAIDLNLQRLELSTGVPLIVREDHRLPFVYVTAAFTGGLLAENSTNNGVFALMAELLTRGTTTRSAEALALEVESLGAGLASFSGRGSFGLQGQALVNDADRLLDIMSDCLLNASLPAEEMEKQRTLQLAALRQQREQPMYVAQEALRQTLFPGHPYRWDPAGSEESVRALTREEILAQYRHYVSRSNLVLSIFGDITADEARALAEKYLSRLPAGAGRVTHVEATPASLPARVERREPREQAILLMGYPSFDVRDPRLDALSVLQKALSGLSSDLGLEIREKRGLVYYVGAFSLVAVDPGFFAFYAGTRDDALPEVEKLVNEQAARLAREGLREDEFRRAVEQLLAAQDMSLQSNSELAQSCAINELYGLGYRYTLEQRDRLARLTPTEVQQVARQLLVPAQQVVVAVRPEEKK
jgi:zinc protease